MAGRRIVTAREQHQLLSPWRTAMPAPSRHPDLEESLRLHGVVHTTGGRRLVGQRLAVADQRTQETRLLDPAGWTRHLTFTPSGLAIQGARSYAGLKNLDDPHRHDYSNVEQTPQTVRTVGRLYDQLPALDPRAIGPYQAMRKEVADQHDFMTNRLGIRTQVVDHDPYSDVHEMMDDINKRKTLKVMGTHVTGGHPFFSDTENNQFRAVHDFFGHAATGRSFDRHGEQAAYLAHSQMFTPTARPALTTETKGQNSSLILNGHFPEQKVAMLPAQHWDERAVDLSPLPLTRAARRETVGRRTAERADRFEWERSFDGGGGWELIVRNPDGNPVRVKTEPARGQRSAARRTGTQTFPYLRNNSGMRQIPGFDQHLEPWGRYMSHDIDEHHLPLQRGWERGTVSFDNPLYVPHQYGAWKQTLSDQYGATGQQLSEKLMADGYDGVITHDKYGIGEMVDVRPKGQRGHRAAALQQRPPRQGELPFGDQDEDSRSLWERPHGLPEDFDPFGDLDGVTRYSARPKRSNHDR